MEANEIKKIKKVLAYLKISRQSDYITFHAMIDGETFNRDVIEPLEKISQWNDEDEKSINESAKKFKKETEGKTLKEKNDKLSKILKISGTVGLIGITAGSIGLMAYKLLKKDVKE